MKKYYVYKVTNRINGKYYIGVHHAANPHDTYYGSGPAIKSAIEKYGIANFDKVILFETTDRNAAYDKEKELVIPSHQDSNSYNLKEGGIGGWDYYNASLDKKQCMHDPKTVKKVSDSLKKKFLTDHEYRDTLLKNAAIGCEAAKKINTGKRRPEHGDRIRELHASGRYDAVLNGRAPSTFIVTDPHGKEFLVYNLGKFCYDNNLPYTSIWKTHLSGIPLKKGKAKNWKCTLIEKENYEEYIKSEQ